MGKATDAVHAGESADAHGSVNTPIVASSTFRYPELPDGSAAPYIYSRYENPSLEAVERRLAALEDAPGSLVFASGMAAIHAVFLERLAPGKTLAIQRGVYGGTMALAEDELQRWGVHVVPFGLEDPLPEADLVWMESITNPLLRVADIGHWADQAKEQGSSLCVDATFASPMLQRARTLGADLVVHSGTKYLGGHADLMAGFVVHGDDREGLWLRRRNTGAILDTTAAYLLGRGMKSLHLRMRRHGENAVALAESLSDHGAVHEVHHPSLPSHPDHAVAARVLDGPCGMLSIDLGSKDAAVRFRRRLRVMTPAASLGGVESLVSLPIETSHAYATAEARSQQGITDGLVRISVGVEDVDDLLEDVTQALA